MSQAVSTGREALVENLRNRDCQYCNEGSLSKGTYKENTAIVCDNCETPALQLW